jgi:Na+/proline symporter
MFGLHPADIVVLVLYFVGITLLGFKAAKGIESMADFFMPRKAGSALLVMHAFGSGTHADQAVGVASKTYTNGLSGIWYQWCWLFPTPFYWLIAALMRRFRAITTGDVFEARFGPSVAMLFAVVGILNLVVNVGVMLKGSGAVVDASTAGNVPGNYAIGLMTIVIVIYGMAGGLSAVIMADFIQGILTIIFSFMLLPFILGAVGGMDGIRTAIKDPQMLSLVAPKEIGLFYIAVIAVNALVGIVTQPHVMGNCAAGKTEMEGRVGFVCGNFVKRFCTIAWCLTGLAAVVYFSGRDINPDHIFGLVAAEFLPKVAHGVLGLFLASLLTSAVGSCDSFMVASAGLFTENIYKRFMPDRKQRHYIFVARITSLAVIAGGAAFAYWLPSVVKGLETFWIISSVMGVAFWMGFFWRRATSAGAWASTLMVFVVWWLTTQKFFTSWLASLPIAEPLRFIFVRDGIAEVYLPWQMVFYLVGGLIVGIVASLLTSPVTDKKLDKFYELVRTPVKPGEKVTLPCTLPADAVVAPKRGLFAGKRFEILVPSRISVIGFLISWVCVALIIYGFYLIVRS